MAPQFLPALPFFGNSISQNNRGAKHAHYLSKAQAQL
jgi:hypothetical protein